MIDWTERDIGRLTSACRWFGIHTAAVKRSEIETEPRKRWAAFTEAAMANNQFLAALRLLGLGTKARQVLGPDGKV